MTTTKRARLVLATCLAMTVTSVSCSAIAGSGSSGPGAPPSTTPVAPTPPTADAARCRDLTTAATANPPLYAPDATWNRPVACLGARADSAGWSTRWFEYASLPGRTDATKRGAIDIAFDEYSTPVYETTDATGWVTVFITGWGHGDNLGAQRTIPWNPSWTPAAGNDLELIIVDRASGTEWGLWGVQKTNWSSCLTLANLAGGYRPGVDVCAAMATIGKTPTGEISNIRTSSGMTDGWGRGMGAIQGLALLPTLDEIERGSINHALNMETYATMFGPACTPAQMGTGAAGTDCGFAVAPATRLEWFDGPAASCGPTGLAPTAASRATTVPEGMRFAITLTDAQIDSWLDTRGYAGAKRRTARIFAVALRDYGWVISDTSCWGSSVSVDGVANPRSAARWNALGIDQFGATGDTLMDGLISSADQVRAIAPPSSAPVLNR